ncbi:DNA ligase 4 isoform X2 [Hylaeus anthracinus]|uniref:DNA ligase 4 isoform X2 n=1 Tax=Hylaeus anthracinus TaxID=313031 RepID=UPI0023BA1835|nr:DNA ligase 4 isoform X2 [Hylaeus anthracinus]XP_054011341.1 DNA ligase 4 isoform X2 [Hylaeus anthracinus]
MSVTLAAQIEFKKLCNVLEEIKKSRAAKKVEILEKFIQQCRNASDKLKTGCPDTDVSLFPIMRLILPHLERERGPHNLKEKSLANLYVRVFCLGKNSKDANYLIQYKSPTTKKISGTDFAEKAYQILRSRLPRDSSGITIERINLFLNDISSRNEITQPKDETFKVLLGKTTALEFKWITRIILKDLKLNIGTKKILQVFHRDANALFNVSSNLRQVCDALCDPQLRYNYNIQVFSHFKPMLLERYRIEDTEKLFRNSERYFVQTKYDGERSQMHMKDGKYKYFTRQGYDITNYPSYGETNSSGFMSSVFRRLLNPQCKSIILDGELMGWHKEKKLLGSKGMNFDVKKLSKTSYHQPCFIAFDIIMYNDVLLNNEPYEERLRILKDAYKEEEGSLQLCKSVMISTSEELRTVFNESIQNKEEGIVIKKCDTKYKPNMRDGTGCYKIKAEYSDDLVEDVDLIILGGYYGEGKFMGLMKSFLMAVASPPSTPEENPSKFLSVVSVSNGISMETLNELWKRFEDKWQNECPANVTPPKVDPPNKWIRPEDSIILTIRATEMTRSNDYPTGYSLRFPRVMNVRTEKPWYSVCTTTELLSLVKDSRPIQKLTKREVDRNDIGEAPEIKVRKTKQTLTKCEEKSPRSNIMDNKPLVHLTRLFDGKEICVINGDDELSKEHIEEILLQHSAKVVQNPLKENYCIIVGNVKTVKAKSIIESKKYDVVSLDWFKRVTKEENWSSLQDFLPWDLICSRESTERRLAQYYDEYYDNFTADADEESLPRSFKKAEETSNAMEFDHSQMKEIDKELFDSGVSPYSIFRGMVGYFDNQSDWSKFQFRFMAGTIKDAIDDSVTHVFVDGDFISSEIKNTINNEQHESVIIIKSKWIGECFRQGQLISNEEYLINI